jgi:hypothetical protein
LRRIIFSLFVASDESAFLPRDRGLSPALFFLLHNYITPRRAAAASSLSPIGVSSSRLSQRALVPLALAFSLIAAIVRDARESLRSALRWAFISGPNAYTVLLQAVTARKGERRGRAFWSHPKPVSTLLVGLLSALLVATFSHQAAVRGSG